jgi:three-Cys-motif partner protein
LKSEFDVPPNDIRLVHDDANSYLQDLCRNHNWTKNRAVLFLDPFGMQVTWETIAAIADTEAIDLWILFPLSAVNRLLKRNGEISTAWRESLNEMFGASDWYDVFYRTRKEMDLLGERTTTVKVATFDLIGQYFVQRLKTIFAGVSDNPLPLFNSTNSPLYLLCFAAANPKGSKTAIKIAGDILRR